MKKKTVRPDVNQVAERGQCPPASAVKLPFYLLDVTDFMKKFGMDNEPVTKDIIIMRLNFLLEELHELAEGLGCFTATQAFFIPLFKKGDLKIDREKTLDALVDLLYVLMGTVRLLGFTEVFDMAWERVHQANMKKVRAVKPTKRGTTFDIIKPVGWTHADLKDLV